MSDNSILKKLKKFNHDAGEVFYIDEGIIISGDYAVDYRRCNIEGDKIREMVDDCDGAEETAKLINSFEPPTGGCGQWQSSIIDEAENLDKYKLFLDHIENNIKLPETTRILQDILSIRKNIEDCAEYLKTEVFISADGQPIENGMDVFVKPLVVKKKNLRPAKIKWFRLEEDEAIAAIEYTDKKEEDYGIRFSRIFIDKNLIINDRKKELEKKKEELQMSLEKVNAELQSIK